MYALFFTLFRSIYMGDILILYIIHSPTPYLTKVLVIIPYTMLYCGSFYWIYKIIYKIHRKCKDLKYELDIENTSILNKKL